MHARSLLLASAMALILCGARQDPGEFGIDALRQHFANALSSGKQKAVIPPGVYRGRIRDGVYLTIENAKNLTIVAKGVTLICEKRTRTMNIRNCTDLTIEGLTVDYDPLPFTQGTIVAVDPADKWVDVKIHKGYDVAPYSRIDLVDRKKRHRKYGMPFLWGTKAEVRPDGIVRVSRGGFGKAAEVGDLASMSTGNERGGACHGIAISHCTRLTLKDVTLHAAPGYGIINGGGHGDHLYDNVRIIPGPKPKGATEERLLTASWDAIQFNNMRKGPTMQNCRIEAAGDDTWSLSSRDYLVLAKEGRTAWLVYRVAYENSLEVGDRLARSLDDPKPRVVKLASVSENDVPMTPELRQKIQSARQWTFYRFELKNLRKVELDMDCPWEAGTSIYSPDRNCSGFVLRNNTFHSSGRAGLINGAGDGLIEGNTYIDVHSAIGLYPNIPSNGGTGAEKIIFRNNTVRGTGHFCPAPWSLGGGAINILHTAPGRKAAPAGVYRNIVIENNTFENIRGPIFVITSVDGLEITGNKFVKCQQHPHLGGGRDWGVDGEALGWFRNNKNVTLADNQIIDRGKYGTREFVGLPSDVKTTKPTGKRKVSTTGRKSASSPGYLGIAVSVRGGKMTVRSARKGTPGAKAGVQAGDRILSWNGEAVSSVRALRKSVDARARGVLKIERDGREMDLYITPASPPKNALGMARLRNNEI